MNVLLKFLKILSTNFHPTVLVLLWDFLIAKSIGNKSTFGFKQSLLFGALIGFILTLISSSVMILPLVFLGKWALAFNIAIKFAQISPLFVIIPFVLMIIYLNFACEEVGTFLVRSKILSENKTGFGKKFLKGEYSISLPVNFNTREYSKNIFDIIFQESESIILEKLNTHQIITFQTHATVIRKIRSFLNQNSSKFVLEVNGVNIMDSFNNWGSLSNTD